MISFPNAKINLGLNVVAKRKDGYHDLETIFVPIDLKDVLEIIPHPQKNAKLEFTSSGLNIIGDINENLCIRAYQLLKKDFDLPAIKMHLHKAIPMGAGLGGGSADGAFTLKMLNEIFELKLSKKKLLNYALTLGSDCPFFIINKPCFATSRGEKLEPIQIDTSNYDLVLINPNVHISTAKAFSKINPHTPIKSLKEIIQQPINTWRKELLNDFEKSLSNDFFVVEHIKNLINHHNALYSSMTGTGSTVYGLFESNTQKPKFNFPDDYMVKWTKLID